MISIGLLGCGRIGQVHARSVMASSRAQLTAIADAVPAAADVLAAETGAAIRSGDEIIAASHIDAVIICTPTDTHADLIEQALAAGKAVLCEKPVDLSSQRVRQCMETIGEGAGRLMIGFQRRFDPHFLSLKARIDAGAIGDVELVTLTSRDPAPPPLSYIEHSGGLYRDMMIHDFDMARFLLGEEPVEVHAMGSSLVDPAVGAAGDVDTAAVMLKTASGKICQISCSRRAAYGYDQRVEVHGSNGMLRAGNLHETTVELADAGGFRADPTMNFFLERYMPAYRAELEYFIDCIAAGNAPSPSGDDGLKAQILADAASEAGAGGGVIRLL